MNSILLAKDQTVSARKWTLALLVIPAAGVISVGIALGNHKALLSACFIVVIIGSVFARKFGQRGTAMGLIAFSSYVLSIFFNDQIQAIPWVVTSIVISIACAWYVRFVIFPKNHRARLFWAKRAFLARTRVILRILIEIVANATPLSTPHPPKFQRLYKLIQRNRWTAVNHHMEALTETMLLMETILVDDLHFPFQRAIEKKPASFASQQTEWFLAIETLCARTITVILKILSEHADEQKRRAIVEALSTAHQSLFFATSTRHVHTMEALREIANAQPDDHRIARLVILLSDLKRYADKMPRQKTPKRKKNTLVKATHDTFPGHTPTKKNSAWYHDFFFQTALKVGFATTVAGIAGYWLAPRNWHWAVIATFVIFIRTKSRGETLLKGWDRFLGTIIGVAFGLLIARFFQNHQTIELIGIFISIFLGYYFLRVSYVWLITFLTMEVVLLYGIMGKPAPELLYIRLGETVLGVTIGMLVAAFILPTKTRSHVNEQIREILNQLSDFYANITHRIDKDAPIFASTKIAFQLSRSLQNLRLTASPLTSYVSLSGYVSTKYQIVLIAVLVYYARNLAMAAAYADYDQATRSLIRQAANDLTSNFAYLSKALNDPEAVFSMRSEPQLITTMNTSIIHYETDETIAQPDQQTTLATRSAAILLIIQSNDDVMYQLANEITKTKKAPQSTHQQKQKTRKSHITVTFITHHVTIPSLTK